MVRTYYITEEGDEITFQLLPEYHVFGNTNSILFNEPSKFTFQALERTKVYTMDYDTFHDVVKNSEFLNLNKMGLGHIPTFPTKKN